MALAGEELAELGAGPDRRRRARRPTTAEAEISVDLGRGEASAHVYFSDLTSEYVRAQRGVHDVMTAEPSARDRVETLLEALPYIREFHGRTVVIKYGGAAMRDEALRDDFATDVVLLKYVGLNPVIVHGGGPDITSYMERLGMEVRFVEGMRVSDAETVEVAKMVLLGKVNADIVMRLNRHGQPAVGLSGEDGALFEIRPHADAERGRLRRRDRARRRRRAQPHRRRLHPGDRLGRGRPRGQLLQRQRRHGGGQGRGGAAAPTRRSSSPTSRAGSPTPTTPAR